VDLKWLQRPVKPDVDRMYETIKIFIDPERCKGCEYCCSVCPKQIIRLSNDYNSKGYHYAIPRSDKECSGCRFCAIMCPEIAIEIELID